VVESDNLSIKTSNNQDEKETGGNPALRKKRGPSTAQTRMVQKVPRIADQPASSRMQHLARAEKR